MIMNSFLPNYNIIDRCDGSPASRTDPATHPQRSQTTASIIFVKTIFPYLDGRFPKACRRKSVN